MRKLRGLRARLILWVTAALVLPATVGGYVYVEGEVQRQLSDSRERAGARLQTLAVPCATALALGRIEELDGLLTELARVEDARLPLEVVAMLDHHGHRVAHSGSTSFGKERMNELAQLATESDDSLWWRRSDRGEQEWLIVSVPAVAGYRWGTLLARFDVRRVLDKAAMLRLSLIAALVVLTLAVVFLLNLGLAVAVIRPIEALARAAGALAAGDLSARAPSRGQDELSGLAGTFNSMALEIQRRRSSLESQVRDRTATLAAVNSQLEQAVQDLAEQARTDPLTGLVNRRAFQEHLAFEMRRTARTGNPIALLALDLDHFKLVNDTHGHPTGDRVLRDVANLLTGRLRNTDIPARVGGEEFAVLLIDADHDAARKVALGLLHSIRLHRFTDVAGVSIGKLTCSGGLAVYPDDADDADGLVALSDLCLYKAKDLGRDRLESWDPAGIDDD